MYVWTLILLLGFMVLVAIAPWVFFEVQIRPFSIHGAKKIWLRRIVLTLLILPFWVVCVFIAVLGETYNLGGLFVGCWRRDSV